jgi:hypothetical protein
MNIKHFLAISMLLFAGKAAKSQQTTLDITDSLANHQKQYIIRFDVANGNIYMPVKKITRTNKDGYKRLPFIAKEDSVGESKIERIIKTFDAKGVLIKADTVYQKEILKTRGTLKYLQAGKFFKPKVGSFIRMIFENVPKGMDVSVSAEFLDKNLENASAFQGYLNSYAGALDTGVNRDVRKLIEDTAKKVKIAKQVDATTSSIDSTIKDLQKKTNTFKSTLDGIQKDLKPLISNTKDGQTLAAIVPSVNELQGHINELKNFKIAVDSTENTNAAFNNKIQQMLSVCKVITDKAIFNGDTVAVLKEKLRLMTKQLAAIDSSKNVFTDLSTSLKILQKQSDSVTKHYDSTITAIYDSIYKRRTIYIQPIQVANNDITLLKVTYRKDDKAQNDINREILLKNKYGFKLDFSTGFIGTGLKDDNYRLVPTPGTSKDTTSIKDDSKGKFAVGFAILAHAYFRTGERINFALNTGLMLNSSNQTVNYLAGLSLPLGLEQRLVISGGVAFGKVKRLTDGFETEKPYPASQLNLSAGVPYTEKWQNSWYIGVSYNLSALASSSHKVVIAR